MSRFRGGLILLGIAVATLVISIMGAATRRSGLPMASSYSAEPNGAAGLFEWINAVGGHPRRLQSAFIRQDEMPALLLVLQPETVPDSNAESVFDAVAEHGGTLVVAGDSVGSVVYARKLGVRFERIAPGGWTGHSPDNSLTVSSSGYYRVRTDEDATPLLVNGDGDWLALRKPYKQGSVVVVAAPGPLLNSSLRDESTARFVFREIVSPISNPSSAVMFDELEHANGAVAVEVTPPRTVNGFLFDTPPGRAILYALVLGFGYLLLGGRRLGPAVPVRPPAAMHRTMFEHVQMLANLYRRAGQLNVVRAAFTTHYARQLAHGVGSPARAASLSQALARIENARTESELISAVASVGDTG